MLSPADHLGADILEDPGGMTWREVKDFLDHMRETCIKDRQELKLEVRKLRRENERLRTVVPDIRIEQAEYRELVRRKDPATMEKRRLAARCPTCGEQLIDGGHR